MVGPDRLRSVKSFTHLESVLSVAGTVDDEVKNRITKACAAFGKLRYNVWNRDGLSLATKNKVYRTAIIPVLLYASKTWTVYSRHIKQLNQFHMSRLRSLLWIKWFHKISNKIILQRTKMQTISYYLERNQVRWADHVSRMPDHRAPKQLLYGEVSKRKRPAHKPRLRFEDIFKMTPNKQCFDTKTWKS